MRQPSETQQQQCTLTQQIGAISGPGIMNEMNKDKSKREKDSSQKKSQREGKEVGKQIISKLRTGSRRRTSSFCQFS